MCVHVQTRIVFAAQTGFSRSGGNKERRRDHAAHAQVARFLFFPVTARCYAIRHLFRFKFLSFLSFTLYSEILMLFPLIFIYECKYA